MPLCIAAGALVATLAVESFTLAWTHSIEKIRWEEDWRLSAGRLHLDEARIRGSGAGMEPPADAVLENGVWRYRPAIAPIERLRLAHSTFAMGYELCTEGRCRPLAELAGRAENEPVELFACAGGDMDPQRSLRSLPPEGGIPAEFDAVLKTPFGALGVRTEDDAIMEIRFLPPGTPAFRPKTALAERACAQLAAYLADPKVGFDLPLKAAGTAFQRSVWKAIAAIPPGSTLTYGEIARRLKSAPRAVGQACGRNPYPVAVPCHRVVASDGSLGGFANARGGYLLDTKRWLLEHERS
jgi:methylated-DNA-[protein]-cysteine S-methyltransferase